MGQPGVPIRPIPSGHYYTPAEVRQRLGLADLAELGINISTPGPRAAGFSGTVWPHEGNPALQSKIIKPPKSYTAENLRELKENMEKLYTGPNMYPITIIQQPRRRFSVRAFIREGIEDLKSFFKPSDKKEIEHGK
jgi:hypothetical protein